MKTICSYISTTFYSRIYSFIQLSELSVLSVLSVLIEPSVLSELSVLSVPSELSVLSEPSVLSKLSELRQSGTNKDTQASTQQEDLNLAQFSRSTVPCSNH